MESKKIPDMQPDLDNLYREETYTDLKVATIRCLVPVKADGSPDDSRPTQYLLSTNIMTQMGALPIEGPIDAVGLREAFEKFPEATEQAIERMMRRAQEMQLEESKRIVIPKAGSGGGLAPGGGRGGPGDLII